MLVNETPDRESLAVLTAELSAAASDGRLDRFLGQPATCRTIGVTAPHPYYVVPADALSTDDGIAGMTLAGWRYLLEVGRCPVGLVTTTVERSGAHRFGGIGTGPSVASVVHAVHIADGLLQGRPEAFRMSAVDVPALHTVLLRVADPTGAATAYLPIGLRTSLHPARLHSGAEVLRALRALHGRAREDVIAGEPVGG